MRERRPFVILKAAISLDGCIAAAPGRADAADVGGRRTGTRSGVRAEVDAIGVGVGTVLADDPLLTARGAYRERPLIARRSSTAGCGRRRRRACSRHATPGPVIIVTTAAGAAQRADVRSALEARGAEIEVAADGTLRAALARLGGAAIGSLLLEGGAGGARGGLGRGRRRLRAAVRHAARARAGRRAVPERAAVLAGGARRARAVEPLGPDVLIEGYVHGPR